MENPKVSSHAVSFFVYIGIELYRLYILLCFSYILFTGTVVYISPAALDNDAVLISFLNTIDNN